MNLCTDWAPKRIIVDFENAIHGALGNIFPDTLEIKGCRFHLTQSWYRKIQVLGLSVEYASGSDEGKWLRHIFGLVFLSAEEVEDSFAFDFMPTRPEGEAYVIFTDYLTETYIHEDALFPPHVWATHSSSLQLTTNACESFHAHFGKYFYTPHPNINLFMTQILAFQTFVFIKLNSAATGEEAQVSNKRITDAQKEVEILLESYQKGEIDRYNFVQKLSYRCYRYKKGQNNKKCKK